MGCPLDFEVSRCGSVFIIDSNLPKHLQNMLIVRHMEREKYKQKQLKAKEAKGEDDTLGSTQ